LENRVVTSNDPRQLGAALTGNLKGLWRYRIGDYRIICRIEDRALIVVVVIVGHRRDIYET
jgi:mRNA interferase RelE/StbE